MAPYAASLAPMTRNPKNVDAVLHILTFDWFHLSRAETAFSGGDIDILSPLEWADIIDGGVDPR